MINSQSRLRLAELARLAKQALRLEPTRTSTSVSIDVWIHDLLDERTSASASWYNECHAAATKLCKSADLDEEGEEDHLKRA
jgi:hypothetical protein